MIAIGSPVVDAVIVAAIVLFALLGVGALGWWLHGHQVKTKARGALQGAQDRVRADKAEVHADVQGKTSEEILDAMRGKR